MPPRLDDDVLLLILDELDTPAYSLQEYLELQTALRHLCSASRQLYRLAKPFLGRQLCLRGRRQLSLLRSEDTAKNRATRCIIAPKVVAGGNSYIDALDLFPNLVDFSFELSSKNADYLRFPQSISALNLRRLSLANVVLSSTIDVVLPHLEALRLSDSRLPHDISVSWLQPACMPSLRTLSLVRLAGPPGTRNDPLALADNLSHTLLPQLDFLLWSTSKSYEAYTPGAGWTSSTTPPVLFDFPSPRTDDLPRHLLHTASYLLDSASQFMRGLAIAFIAVLEGPGPFYVNPAFVLVLPRRFLDFAADNATVDQAIQDFEAIFVSVGWRIMWYDGDTMARGVDVTLLEFCEYARALKAAR